MTATLPRVHYSTAQNTRRWQGTGLRLPVSDALTHSWVTAGENRVTAKGERITVWVLHVLPETINPSRVGFHVEQI